MKEIYSKSNKKKKCKNRFKKYWRLLEPKKYVDLMTAREKANVRKTAERLRSVSLFGVLQKTDEGFVYLKISNDVIHGLFALIDEENIEKPPYFGDGVGAHVSVMSKEETEDLNIKEIGEEFSFKLGEFSSVKPQGWKEMERVWFVELDAPELNKLRKKYKLPETYKDLGHNFHITIAVRKKK